MQSLRATEGGCLPEAGRTANPILCHGRCAELRGLAHASSRPMLGDPWCGLHGHLAQGSFSTCTSQQRVTNNHCHGHGPGRSRARSGFMVSSAHNRCLRERAGGNPVFLPHVLICALLHTCVTFPFASQAADDTHGDYHPCYQLRRGYFSDR